VNYFNDFGRQWQVYVQADAEERGDPRNLGQFYVRNGERVHGSDEYADPRQGPAVRPGVRPQIQPVPRRYRSWEATPKGTAAARQCTPSSRCLPKTMPAAMGFDYMGMSFPGTEGGARCAHRFVIFALSFLVVFLIMAAQYESWTLPISVFVGHSHCRVWRVSSLSIVDIWKTTRNAPDRSGHADRLGCQECPSSSSSSPGTSMKPVPRSSMPQLGREPGQRFRPISDDCVRFYPRMRPAVGLRFGSWQRRSPYIGHDSHWRDAGRFPGGDFSSFRSVFARVGEVSRVAANGSKRRSHLKAGGRRWWWPMNKLIARMLGVLVVSDWRLRRRSRLSSSVDNRCQAVYRRGGSNNRGNIRARTHTDFAQARWWTIFADPVLQSLIHERSAE